MKENNIYIALILLLSSFFLLGCDQLQTKQCPTIQQTKDNDVGRWQIVFSPIDKEKIFLIDTKEGRVFDSYKNALGTIYKWVEMSPPLKLEENLNQIKQLGNTE